MTTIQTIKDDAEQHAFYVGQTVQVDFVSDSSTEFSGTHFKGVAVIDVIEDTAPFYIMGRLKADGKPFMCPREFVQSMGAVIQEPIHVVTTAGGHDELYRRAESVAWSVVSHGE